jgi:hypothetical protein
LGRIAGPEHTWILIFLEWVTIETMVSPKAYMELCSELRGEKWVGLKPPLDTPAIAYFHKVTAQGHMKEGDNEKEVSA